MKFGSLVLKIFAVTILLFASAASLVFSISSENNYAQAETVQKSSYVYGNIDVTADVGEDKVLLVTEKMEVGFEQEGVTQIIRRVMRKYSATRLINGRLESGRKFIANVSDIQATVNGERAKIVGASDGNYYSVHIYNADGSSFESVHSADNLYNIQLTYAYDISGDKLNGFDDLIFFFFNEQSYRYYLERQKLTLTLNMPKQFESSALVLLNGNSGNIWQPQAEKGEGYEVSGNTIRVCVTAQSAKYLTIQLLLPDGYFNISFPYYSCYWIFFRITCAAILVTLAITFIYRKRKPIVPVELYPPDCDLLRYSAYWHGYAKRRDMCAVIFQWAQAGCLKIIKDGKKDVILQKLKDLPEDSPEEQKNYFNALFMRGDVYRSREIKKIENIVQAHRVGSAVSDLVAKEQTPELYTAGSKRAKLLILTASVVAALISLIYFLVLSADVGYWVFFGMLVFASGFGLGGVYAKWKEVFEIKECYRWAYKILAYGLLCFAGFVCLMYGVLISLVYIGMFDYAGLLYINIAWLLMSVFVLPRIIGRRTEEAQNIYGRMLGFRRFILTAELSRITALIDENPDYFYEILPYCMVMGISRKIDKRLQHIQFAAPEWASGFSITGIVGALFASAKSALKGKRMRNENK